MPSVDSQRSRTNGDVPHQPCPDCASLAPEMVTSSQNAVSGPLYATRCEAEAPRELTIRAPRFVRQSGPMDSALKAARYKVTALLIALYSIT